MTIVKQQKKKAMEIKQKIIILLLKEIELMDLILLKQKLFSLNVQEKYLIEF